MFVWIALILLVGCLAVDAAELSSSATDAEAHHCEACHVQHHLAIPANTPLVTATVIVETSARSMLPTLLSFTVIRRIERPPQALA